ncbi:hypothetical protein [Leptospira selangorensis]|uniref:hypothetical protein n=1 Tax=Leptospira selangorensis TaxID=2484982 RepID=UPI001FD4EB57|nr:hypothetical protein [Leptospira selangorensis]
MLQQKDEEIHIKLENLKQIVIEENTKILESLEEKVQKKYEEKEKELLNKIQNVQYYSRASVAHIQGLIFGFNEYEIEAATYYVNAAEYYFLNSDDYNLSIVCGNLINREKNLISLDLQNNKGKKFISDLKALLNKLKKDQNSGTARKLVHDIETAFYSLL